MPWGSRGGVPWPGGYPGRGGYPGWGVPCQGGTLPGGTLLGGTLVRGDSLAGGYPGQGGTLAGGVPCQGGTLLGGYPGQGGFPGRGVHWPGGRTLARGGIQLGQHREYLLHGGRYASCVHAGGLSCPFCDCHHRIRKAHWIFKIKTRKWRISENNFCFRFCLVWMCLKCSKHIWKWCHCRQV